MYVNYNRRNGRLSTVILEATMQKLKRTLPLLLVLALLAAYLPLSASAAPEQNPMRRIGLYFNSNSLPEARLENEVGSGYTVGTYKNGRTFTGYFKLTDTKLSMFKNVKMVYTGSGFAESGSGTTIGAYSVDIGETFANEAAMTTRLTALKKAGHKAYPAISAGKITIRVGSYIDNAAAAAAIPALKISTAKVVAPSNKCITIGNFSTGAILAQYDDSTNPLGIQPIGTNALTWFKGYKYYGGFEYNRKDGNNIMVVNLVLMQDYVKGVLPYEMNAAWNIEALKAQAIAARSFSYFRNDWHKKTDNGNNFDMCNNTHCQMYCGANSASANSNSAVDKTLGVYAYYNGTPAMTVYHSSDGGQTESAELMWGGTYPYLQPVTDPYEKSENAYRGVWSYTYNNTLLSKIMKEKGVTSNPIVDMYIEERTPAGNVYKLTVVDNKGNKYSFTKDKARSILSSSADGVTPYSIRYWLTKSGSNTLTMQGKTNTTTSTALTGLYAVGSNKKVTALKTTNGLYVLTSGGLTQVGKTGGDYVVNGKGWGNNIGMSQYGARDMANAGFKYDQILKFYYKGITVESGK